MFVGRQEKENLVIDLYYNQGKTFRDIAKEVRMSFTDISFIIKKKEVEEEKKNASNKNKSQQLSLFAKAYKLYSKGKSPVQVAIDLNIPESQTTQFYREYWNLVRLHQLNYLYEKTNGKIWPLWELYQELMEKRNMNIEQVGVVVDTAINELPYIESLYEQAKDEVGKMQDKRQYLLNEVDFLNDKISKQQRTASALEQNCKRKEDPEITQEFNDPKEIMKIVVASVINYIQASVNDTISSSNPTLSLPLPSSATLPVQFNQNDTFLNQESEIHEMHKGDIID